MRSSSTYFIVDFSYNPDSKKPLVVFELGDAFLSEYPNKKMGLAQLTPYQCLINDIKKMQPEGLFIEFDGIGLRLIDLKDSTRLTSYDKKRMFEDNLNEKCDSYDEIRDFILEVVKNSDKRDENSRRLILYLGHPILYRDLDFLAPHSNQVKILNHDSLTLHRAFLDKRELARHASGSVIFPNTLVISCIFDKKSSENAIDKFLAENKAEHYVLKPGCGTHAEHVHVVNADHLKQTLQDITNGKFADQSALSAYTNQGLLIQVCHLSKLLNYQNNLYYAKSRAIIRADFAASNDKPVVTLVTAYWQLANMPAKYLVQDKTVIANIEANREGILEMSSADWENINAEFIRHFPSVLEKMQHYDNKSKQIVFPLLTLDNIDDPQERLIKAITSFIDNQYLLPAHFSLEERVYYYINTYLDDSHNKMLIKKFIIDMVGLNKDLHDLVVDSDESIEGFTTRCTSRLFDKKNSILSMPATFRYRVKQESKYFLLNFLAIFTAISMYEKSIVPSTFVIAVGGSLLNRTVSYLSSTRMCGMLSFFKSKEKNRSFASAAVPSIEQSFITKAQ